MINRNAASREKSASLSSPPMSPNANNGSSALQLDGISIEIQRKQIKNLYLAVKPPDGRVVLSAPVFASCAAIEAFARSKLPWLKHQLNRLAQHPPAQPLQYVSGELLPVWGQLLPLVVLEQHERNGCFLQDGQVLLSLKQAATLQQRQQYVLELYRRLLKQEAARLFPVWEAKTGLYCTSWQCKAMRTRWGSCNVRARRIWLSVYLASRPLCCLEYVILHELAHLKVANHGPQFTAILDRYLPTWRDHRQLLNGQALSSIQ